MAALTLTYDTFGGPENVFHFLCHVGVVSTSCPECHIPAAIEYLKDRPMPRIRCSCGYRRSCLSGTIFHLHKIEDIHLFMFVMRSYVLRVSVKAIAGLTGAKEDTVTKYLNVIKGSICASFEHEVRNPDFMFGGEGKVVEIDEAFISRRKYYCGRKRAKEGVWIVGMTEVDTSTREIDDQALLERIQDCEARRQALSLVPRRRFKTAKKAVKMTRTPFAPSHVPFQEIEGGSLIPTKQTKRSTIRKGKF